MNVMQRSGNAFTVCPGCGVRLAAGPHPANPKIHASAECLALCHELAFYTLKRNPAFFIHQVAVDSYAAQHASPQSKPITVAFALIGLCLFLERNASGKDVRNEHMRLARMTKEWPVFSRPTARATVTVADVLQARSGDARDAAIREWAQSVWDAWEERHESIRLLIDRLDQGSTDRATRHTYGEKAC